MSTGQTIWRLFCSDEQAAGLGENAVCAPIPVFVRVVSSSRKDNAKERTNKSVPGVFHRRKEATIKTAGNIMKTGYLNADQSPKIRNPLNKTKFATIGFTVGAAFIAAFTGCVGYVEGPRHAAMYARPAPVYVQSGPVVQVDYVYYPGYQVYYCGSTRQYVYQDGHAWVTRPEPPRVSADVLLASPSVRLDFHDAPASHHAEVVKQYPKHWKPSKSSHGNNQGHRNDNREVN